MGKLTDEELDGIFRSASEQYRPPFDAGAWDAMNTRLDKPRTPMWKSWMTFSLVGLIIFGSGVWLGTYLKNTDALGINDPVGEIVPTKEQIVPQNSSSKPSDTQALKIESKPANETPQQTLKGINGFESDKVGLYKPNHQYKNIESEKTQVLSAETDSQSADTSSQESDNHREINLYEDFASETILKTDSLTVDIAEINAIDSTSGVSKNQSDVKAKVRGRKNLFLRVAASPDLSMIDYTPITDIGSNVSLLLEYNFHPRLSIATGVIKSFKKYDYNKEFAYNNRVADRMSGSCSVLDIPLNFYYRFGAGRMSYFPSVGFSSYIMLQENYTYIIDFPTGTRSFPVEYKNKSNEWFKMLNASFGFQYQWKPLLAITAEPFIKTPISELGVNDVKLSSLGIFIGFKYRLK